MGVLLAAFHRLIRRMPSIAVVTLALASMLAMQWHEGSVVHVRCDAHGEMTHLGGSSVVAGEAGAVGNAHFDRSSGGQVDDDDHCQFLGAACSAIVKIATPVAIDDHATLLVNVAPPLGAVIARATFRLAPKTSPPV
jgi:hypothetical protein